MFGKDSSPPHFDFYAPCLACPLKSRDDSLSNHPLLSTDMMKQAQGLLLSALFIGLLFPWSHFASAQEVEDESEFSYMAGSPNGPEHWGEIHHEWALCKNGDMQSPIDLLHERVHVSPALGRIQRCYRASNATLKNRGHDIMMRWEGGAGTIRINGTHYELRQCHWHSPSEHTIDGKRFAMELHMVHVSADERVAVVGILYTVGRPDTFLAEMMEYIQEVADRKEEERAVGFVDPRHIRIGSQKYYRYMGSLTTPPCDQGVTWTITQKIRTASREQIGLLREAVHDDAEANARPVQAINGREIQFYSPWHRKDAEVVRP